MLYFEIIFVLYQLEDLNIFVNYGFIQPALKDLCKNIALRPVLKGFLEMVKPMPAVSIGGASYDFL